MNDETRMLIRYVCDGDKKNAQRQARIILEKLNTQKDERFKKEMLRRLECSGANLIELPAGLRGLLVAEHTDNFSISRFLLRGPEDAVVQKLLATYAAAKRLEALGIPYLPSAILHGPSGTGKTMLARYVAYKAGLPFVYVRFSALIDGVMGKTSVNINRVFSYVKDNPCVFCLDEIDAIGASRGGSGGDSSGSEMSRVTISLMQELDTCPNSVLVIGTTNRYDALDEALKNRFSTEHKVVPLAPKEIIQTVELFYKYVGIPLEEPTREWFLQNFTHSAPNREIVRCCTEKVVDYLNAHPDFPSESTSGSRAGQRGA